MLPGFYNYLILSSVASFRSSSHRSLTILLENQPPLQTGTIWLVCGSEKAFPIPHHHSAAPSQNYSTLNSSQTAAQNSKQKLEQHFIHFSESPASVLEWKHSSIKTKNIPKGFPPPNCFRLIVSSEIGGNRGGIHHWALHSMVNLLQTGSLWAETHKINSATQNWMCYQCE